MESSSMLERVELSQISGFKEFLKTFDEQTEGFAITLALEGTSDTELLQTVSCADKLSVSTQVAEVYLKVNKNQKRQFIFMIKPSACELNKEVIGFHLRWACEKALQKISQLEAAPVRIYLQDTDSLLLRRVLKDLCYKSLPKGLDVFSGETESVYKVHVHYTDKAFDQSGFREELETEAGLRKWVNENPETLTSIEIGERMRHFAQESGAVYSVLETEEIKDKGLELLYRVGRASIDSPPRLHILEMRRPDDTRPPLLLVGKGITFDTGGINLKAFESHVGCMKNDMGGAALMFHLAKRLKQKGYEYPVVLAVPACENSIDSNAMKPGSIYRSYSGKTVKVEHTDAEGRLILADAIAYCEKKYKPVRTAVAATLTTAALRQFTGYQTPVHFADKPFERKLSEVASDLGEFYSFHPFLPAYAQGNKDPVADLTNMGRLPSVAAMGGGSNIAAHFLKEFSSAPNFVHIDIFASAWNWSGDYPGADSGATGACLESLATTICSLGEKWFKG